MIKEIQALNNLIRINRDKEKVSFNVGITFAEAMDNYELIKQALNDLEDLKHNYAALEEMHNNSVAYATRIQTEFNELKKDIARYFELLKKILESKYSSKEYDERSILLTKLSKIK